MRTWRASQKAVFAAFAKAMAKIRNRVARFAIYAAGLAAMRKDARGRFQNLSFETMHKRVNKNWHGGCIQAFVGGST
jgi:hypothetical protein